MDTPTMMWASARLAPVQVGPPAMQKLILSAVKGKLPHIRSRLYIVLRLVVDDHCPGCWPDCEPDGVCPWVRV
jgi:hypothetical protein